MTVSPTGTVDAHVHLWQRARTPQEWIDPKSMHAIDRDFWFDDLDEVLTGNGVSAAVIVQASNSSQETQDLLTAHLPPRVGAIVGWIDLESPLVEKAIDDANATQNGAFLSGVRHLAHVDPDPHWLTKPSVSRGLDALESAGLSFDLVVRAEQLADAAKIAGEHPGLTFVLDHLGKPALRSEDISGWESALWVLAKLPNVFAKVSGLTMEAEWDNWNVGDLERAVTVALESLGPQRLMFGSDWPLVEVCGGYGSWIDAALDLTSGLSAVERDAIFCGTARSVYRIGGAANA
jgi:L-fuconolactonase